MIKLFMGVFFWNVIHQFILKTCTLMEGYIKRNGPNHKFGLVTILRYVEFGLNRMLPLRVNYHTSHSDERSSLERYPMS